MEYTSPGTAFDQASDAPLVTGEPAIFAPTDTNHFFIDLKAQDTLQVFNQGSGFTPFIAVQSGRAYAFFFDKNLDNIPQTNELSGLVLSAGARVSVSGSVDGDILATLNAQTGQFWTSQLGTSTQTIGSLSVSGNVDGSIIAAGNISNISVAGSVEQVRAGLSASYNYDFGGTGAGPGVGEGTLAAFDPGSSRAGGNLSNVTVGNVDTIAAGKGGAGGLGGSITNVRVISDPNGLQILAGDGGDGLGSVINGGRGGNLSQIVIQGTAGSNANLIHLSAGDGGDALAGSRGAGGAGGTTTNVWVGYEPAGRGFTASQNTLLNQILVESGDGGDGLRAGAGGNASDINVIAAPGDALAPGYEMTLRAGDAGGVFTGLGNASAAAGGSLSNFSIWNLNTGSSDVLVQAGDASAPNPLAPEIGTGAAGGSITGRIPQVGANAPLVGNDFTFLAGDGSDMTLSGGNGGSISNLVFGQTPNVFLQYLSVIGGMGGDATTGSGGLGGSVTRVEIPYAELTGLTFIAGAGGDSLGNGVTGGSGGRGGSLNNIQVFDFDTNATLTSVFASSGNAGDGFRQGGIGGDIVSFSFFGGYASLTALSGRGGDVLGTSGSGGNAGNIRGLAFSQRTDYFGAGQTATVTASDGGLGKGNGRGGNGGSITNVNIKTIDSITFTAGQGGATGDRGTTGNGGAIGGTSSALGVLGRSLNSSLTFTAGDAGAASAGTSPTRGGNGGSINFAVGYAATTISFAAGDGQLGGQGGDVGSVGFAGPTGPGSPITGNVTVLAGNGGNAATPTGTGGRGGNINVANGSTSDNLATLVRFEAGQGGSGGRGGLGGSVTGVTIFDGDAPLAIIAGNGGNGTAASGGGAGGSVNRVAVASDAVIRAIAAGDGGNSTTGRGANGGSVNQVNVHGDIGIRSGQNFGFATDGTRMGGIFAGKAGTGTTTGALSGNVSNVTADAIASIVAGRDTTVSLVNRVDRIYLNGLDPVKVNPGGSFSNFGTANLVGGKAGNPAVAGASDFQYQNVLVPSSFSPSNNTPYGWDLANYRPTDGLIAALTLTSARNFIPLALVTTSSNPLLGSNMIIVPAVTPV